MCIVFAGVEAAGVTSVMKAFLLFALASGEIKMSSHSTTTHR